MTHIFLFIFPIFFSCDNAPDTPRSLEKGMINDTLKVVFNYKMAYDLDHPDATFEMPDNLEEISGLSMTKDGKKLAAVNDERGKIYFIDKQNGEVEKGMDFWKDGDYEGVEVVGNEVFVVKSSGTIYEVKNLGDDNPETIKHKFFLTRENDVEGLAFDEKHNRLLLGCKGLAGIGEELKMKKAIYAFDLTSRQLSDKPIFTISVEKVHQYLGTDKTERNLEKLWEFFEPGQSEFGFNPSAIAIHPKTGDIFITSSVGKLLLVLSPNGEILYIEKLKKEVHPQPEGMCFDHDGALYISNEGKWETAKIYRFDYGK